MFVKITKKGWAGYTGPLGTAYFENGFAELASIEANRIGSITEIVEVDEEGNEIGPVRPSHGMVVTRNMSAPVTASRRALPGKPAEKTEEPEENEDGAEGGGNEETEEATVYTRDELEKIADEKGIGGLREIATPLGLKSTSMADLIEQILDKQEDENAGAATSETTNEE